MDINNNAKMIKLWFEIINFSLLNALFVYAGGQNRILFALSLLNSFLIGYYATERFEKIFKNDNNLPKSLVLIVAMFSAFLITATLHSAVKYTFDEI